MNEIGPPYGYPAEPPRPEPRRRRPGWLVTVVLVALLVAASTVIGRALPTLLPPGWHSAPWTSYSESDEASGPVITPTGLPADRSDLVAASSRVAQNLVNVNVLQGYQGTQGAGTGIVISPSGEILTNNHVINGATAIQVRSIATGRAYPATVVGYDRTHDIAVLRPRDGADLRPATLGNSDAVAVGDPVAAVGNAGGTGRPTVAPGTVSALDRSITTSDELTGSSERLAGLIEVAANVEAGESGGPLINSAGQVVGVTTAASVNFRYQTPGGTGYAIPINAAVAIARQITAGSASNTVHVGPTGMLGVTVVSAATNRPDNGGDETSNGTGTTVERVTAGSPAAQIGLSRGAVIVSLDGRSVDSATTLVALVAQHHPGDRLTIGWLDPSGQRHNDTVTLAPGPPA